MRALIVVVIASGIAHADSEMARVVRDASAIDFAVAPVSDASLLPPNTVDVEELGDAVENGEWSLDARVGAATDLAGEGVVQTGIEIAYDLPMCRVVGGSWTGALGGSDGVAWRARATGCLPLPVDLVWMYAEHVENTRASLFDGVLVIRERRSVNYAGFHAQFYRSIRKGKQIDVFPFDFNASEDESKTWGEVGIVHWHRKHRGHDGSLTLRFLEVANQTVGDPQLASSGEPIEGARRVLASQIMPVVIDNLVIAPHTALDVAIGFAQGWGSQGEEQPFLRRHGAHADVALRVSLDAVRGRVRGTHALHAAYGMQLVQEDRVAAELERTRECYVISSEAFVARQTVIRDAPGGRTVVASGAAVDGAFALHRGISLAARFEAGRTLDAVRAEDPVRTTWDVRATFGLQARYHGVLR